MNISAYAPAAGARLQSRIYKYRYYYLMLLPAIAYYLVFHYAPMFGIAIAFYDYNIFKGFAGSQWVGLQWFQKMLSTREFFTVLRNTALISAITISVTFPAPIIFALMLNECRALRFKRVIQTVSYLPHFISWSIIAGLVINILSPTTGIVNHIIRLTGGRAINFIVEPEYTRAIMVVSSLWQSLGWSSIIYLAAVAGVSPELYEAAIIDGANKLQQIWHVTLPGMKPIIVMQMIFTASGLFSVGFEQAYNLVLPATYSSGQVLSTYVYRIGLGSRQYGFSTAVGLMQSLVSIALLTGANMIANRFYPEGAIW